MSRGNLAKERERAVQSKKNEQKVIDIIIRSNARSQGSIYFQQARSRAGR